MTELSREAEAFLPLPSATLHILLALADEDRHGYAIIQDIAARTDGALKLSAGTLYRSIQRMLEDGLITEPRERPAPDEDDERRRYYRITPLGRAVAKAEVRGFAAMAVVIIALGIGATTAAFSITDFVLIRPLPFPHPDRLVKVWERHPGFDRMQLSPDNYRDLKRTLSSFENWGAYRGLAVN